MPGFHLSLAYLPIHKLQYKILKLSSGRAQFSFHLQFSNTKEAQKVGFS